MNFLYNIIFTIASIFCLTNGLFAQPKFAIKEGKEFQLGEVKEGAIVKKQLTLMNVGTGTLTLDEIRTTCGCTVAKTTKKKLESGDTTLLTIAIDTKDSRGPLKKQVFIATNVNKDKEEEEIILYITVRNIIEFKPIFMNFHTVSFGNSFIDTVTVFNTSEKALTITSLTSPDSQITLRMSRRKIPPHDSSYLIAKLAPKKRGSILGQFEINTDNSEKKSLKLSFIGKIR